MEKGFYSWYEEIFSQCSRLVGNHAANSIDARIGAFVGTNLFSGKFTSSSVVIRMKQSYDFILPGAWASSFKSFVYRQQNYNHILYELYADQLDRKLVNEHRHLYSFLEGNPLQERVSVNRMLGSRLDQTLKVVLPSLRDLALLGSPAEAVDVLCIMKGIFLWERNFVVIEGEDTLTVLINAGVPIKTVLVKTYALAGKPIEVKFAGMNWCGIYHFMVVLPCFAELDTLPSQVSTLRREVDNQLRRLEASRMSTDFIRPNFANFINT